MNTFSSSRNLRRKVQTVVLAWPPADQTGRTDLLTRLSTWTPRQTCTPEQLGWAKAVGWNCGSDSWPTVVGTARAALLHAARLNAENHQLDTAVALSFSEVERTVATILSKRPAGIKANEISYLREAARSINPLGGWSAKPSTEPRRNAPAPYTYAEQVELARIATTLRSVRRRQELTIMTSLAFGAGVSPVEAAGLTAGDITTDTTGQAWVTAENRIVPMRAAFSSALTEALKGFEPGQPLLSNTSRNSLPDANSYARSHGMKTWDPFRAVNSWRVFQLSRAPLPVLTAGSDLSASHIAGLLAHCEPVTDLSALADMLPCDGDEPKAGTN